MLFACSWNEVIRRFGKCVFGHAFAFGGPLPRARALQGGGGKVWFIGLMEEICHWSKEV